MLPKSAPRHKNKGDIGTMLPGCDKLALIGRFIFLILFFHTHFFSIAKNRTTGTFVLL